MLILSQALSEKTEQYLKQKKRAIPVDARECSRAPAVPFVSRGKADRIRPVKPQDQSRMGAVPPRPSEGHKRSTYLTAPRIGR